MPTDGVLKRKIINRFTTNDLVTYKLIDLPNFNELLPQSHSRDRIQVNNKLQMI